MNGTYLLGGAVSTMGNENPSYPLTAKLVRADENANASPDTNTLSNNTQTSFWTWLQPNQSSLNRGQIMTYNIGAWNEHGIKRIEILVNGASRRTCELGLVYGNQNCSVTLSGTDFRGYNSFTVHARVTDGSNQTTESAIQTIALTGDDAAYSAYDYNGYGYNSYYNNRGQP
jgi:hypothetical protein